MKKISLTKNKSTIVDDSSFDWLNRWKWHFVTDGYVARREYPSRKYIYMHRQIINAKKGEEVDHINLDTLDNRKSNLRKVTRSQNMANTELRSTNTSGHKGVSFDKTRKKWLVEITVNYKKIYLGRFDNELEAVKSYNKAASKYFGKFARLNKLGMCGNTN